MVVVSPLFGTTSLLLLLYALNSERKNEIVKYVLAASVLLK